MPVSRSDFIRVAYAEPHAERARRILAAHPEVRRLFGIEPLTPLYGMLLAALQVGLAVTLSHAPWVVFVVAAYVFGATLNHALWVLIHDCAHGLACRSFLHNRLLAIGLNLPHAVPSAMSFFKYHLLHHVHQGDLSLDGDLPGIGEARQVGNAPLRKLLMLLFFSFVMGILRPARLRRVRLVDGWFLLNFLAQAVFLVGLCWLHGFGAVLFLLLSTFFGLGLHPLGGRWIAEHYVVAGEQETYSYYGGLNRVAFNVGYHVEHHDFMRVPWSRLPRLRQIAPGFYRDLHARSCWFGALWQFIFDARASAFDRVVRDRARPAEE